jgi:PAS domain S-box-containing protein
VDKSQRFDGRAIAWSLGAVGASIVVLQAAARLGWEVPSPASVLAVAVVFASFRGGLGAGLTAAAVAWIYTAAHLSETPLPFRYSEADFGRLIVWSLSLPMVAMMVGTLNRRAQRAAEAVAEGAALATRLFERRMVEEALARSEARFRGVAGSAPIGIFETDAGGQTTYVNAECREITGLSAQRSMGLGWLDAVHPADRAALVAEWEAARVEGRESRATYRYVHADGDIRWVEGRATCVHDSAGEAAGYVGVLRDITETRRAELHERAKRWILAEANQAGRLYLSFDWRLSIDGILGRLGVAAAAVRAELVQDQPQDPLPWSVACWRQGPPPTAPADLAVAAVEFEWRERVSQGEIVLRNPSYSTPDERAALASLGLQAVLLLPVRPRGEAWGWLRFDDRDREVPWSEPEIEALLGAAETLAVAIDRQNADEALWRGAERMRELFEDSPLPIWDLDFSAVQGILEDSGFFRASDPRRFLAENPEFVRQVRRRVRVVNANRPALSLLGVRSRRELIANLDSIFDERTLADSMCGLAALQRGESAVRFETTCRNLVGESLELQVHWTIPPGRELDLSRVLMSISDQTERKRVEAEKRALETQLELGRRMETVGRLAGGIAHDFNNLLTVILGAADVLRENGVHAEVDSISDAGERAAELTRQLLAFSRRQVLQPTTFDLNRTVWETQKLVGRLWPEHIECVIEATAADAFVLADATQCEQVLMNLLINARDAMPEGGRLMISTEIADGRDVRWEGRSPRPGHGQFVVVTVRDSGPGLSAEALERCFEPFFTTKGPGHGTGLGLATAYGIVKQSGGYLWASNAPDGGAIFEVLLPRASRVVHEEPAVHPERQRRSNSGRILLVEDNPRVRSTVRLLLEHQGFAVVEAGSPQQALEIARGRQKFDLLLSDFVMPQMNGERLRQEIQSLRPGVRTLLMTGYSDDAVRWSPEVAVRVPLLQKPFTAQSLAAAIDDALESTGDRLDALPGPLPGSLAG